MQRIFRCVLVFLALFFVITPVRADQIDTYIADQLKKQRVPGLSLAVVQDGKLIKAKGYGLANVELNVPATEHTVYQWASVTKQFTAAAILLLAGDGKLALDDLIRRYYTNAPAAWSNVTVRHLLTHTSGIKSYTSLPNFFATVRKDYQPEELIGLVRELPLEFNPGDKFAYSNTGYYLLGLIIESAGGRSYGDFLKERIFRPLSMDTARINHQFQLIPNRATGYDRVSNEPHTAEFVSPTQPFAAGALLGTVLDLAKWDAALYGDKLLATATREQMWTAAKLNNGKTSDYGFGWSLGEQRSHPFVGHGGGIHGFTTLITRFFKDKLTVIVLINGPANAEEVVTHVAGHYLPGLTLSSVKPQRDPDPELTLRLKQCLVDLAEKRDSEWITPQFRENYANSRGRAADLKNRLKELKSFTYVTTDEPSASRRERLDVPVARLCSYKMATGDETRFYTFELTADNKVAWYQTSAD